MQDLDYVSTFIAVAPDSPVASGRVPLMRGPQPTVAELHYRLLAERPYGRSQREVLLGTFLARRLSPETTDAADIAAIEADFAARNHACLRASPLTKTHGWGVHFNADGRAALIAVDSAAYQHFIAGGDGVNVVFAMRSKRG